MKTITIMRLRGGAEGQAKALELFAKYGPAEGTEFVLGSTSSQVFVSLVDHGDEPDLASIATYAPYFDLETFPVVELDEAWMAAMTEAVQRQQ